MKATTISNINHTGILLWLTAAIWFLLYNTYFGWNMKALSESEEFCDTYFESLFISGCLFMIGPRLFVLNKVYKKVLADNLKKENDDD